MTDTLLYNQAFFAWFQSTLNYCLLVVSDTVINTHHVQSCTCTVHAYVHAFARVRFVLLFSTGTSLLTIEL